MLEHATNSAGMMWEMFSRDDGALEALVQVQFPFMLLGHGHLKVFLGNVSPRNPRVLLLVFGKTTSLQLVQHVQLVLAPLLGRLMKVDLPSRPASGGSPSVQSSNVISVVSIELDRYLALWSWGIS